MNRLAAAVLVCAILASASRAAWAQSNAAELVVATYNIRYASSTGPNAWPERRPLLANVIRKISPDILGTQEGLLGQLRDIESDVPEYRWVGTGRDGGMQGEFMAIFYRHERLQPISTNHFWLSDTPGTPGSTSWGNRNRRMATGVRFRDRISGRAFEFYNTHLDHEIAVAREKGAQLIRQRLETLDSPIVILTGDFNIDAAPNSVYDTLTGGGFLEDSWTAAAHRAGEGVGTFNGFRSIPTNGPRIDWILTRGVTVNTAEIIITGSDGRWPSDHFPVVSKLTLPRPASKEQPPRDGSR